MNQEQLFTITAISRGSIANTVSDSLDWIGYVHKDGDLTFLDICERLTDEICQKYADMLSEIDYIDDSEEYTSNQEQDAIRYVLEQLGYVEEETEPVDKIELLCNEILSIELILNEKRTSLEQLKSEQQNES